MIEPVGERLKKARLEKGISLEEAHKKTKLHLNILKALEEDNLINFSPVYIKGFLKIYCDFLGLDARDYIADYKEPKPILKASTVKIVYSQVRRIKTKKIIVFILAALLLFGLFGLGKVLKQAKIKTAAPAAEENKARDIIRKDGAKSLSSITLGIRAKEDCWIKLIADGRIVFQNILKKGRSETWNAKDKVELSLGNAGGVDLEVNGKIISSLGKRGEVVKNILITKEGLSVKR